MTTPRETLGDRIRMRRDARNEMTAAIKDELKEHIDAHFVALHARLDKLEKDT